MRERAERHFHAARGMHVDVLQRVRTLAEAGIDFHHHVILVLVLVHDRDLALSEGVIEGAVDRSRRDSQPRGGFAINYDGRFESLVLLVAGDVAQLRHGAHLLVKLWRPRQQVLKVVALQRVLELRIALASADVYVLHRNHEELSAGNVRELRTQAVDDLEGRFLSSFTQRLKRNKHVGRVQAAAPAGEADGRIDGWIFENDVVQSLQLHPHGVEGDVLLRQNSAGDAAGVLLWEKPFRNDDVQVHAQADGQNSNQQHQRLIREHRIQHALITSMQPVEGALTGVIEAAMLAAVLRLQELGTHHRRGGERKHQRK